MKQLYICNIKNCVSHCKEECFHGKPHDKGNERKNICTTFEFCDIVKKRIRCRKLYKKELKILRKE